MHSKEQTLERFIIVRLFLSIYRIRAVRALFPVAIIALMYIEGQHELKQIDLGLIMRELRGVPTSAISQMIGMALLSVAVMSAYDYLIRAHFRLKVSLWSTFRYAWIANTFNNLIGFAGLAGVGLRTLLYKKSGVPTVTLTPAIVFLSPLMITGLSIFSWANILGVLPATALLEQYSWLVFAIWGMALYLPIFVLIQRSSLYANWINQGKGRTSWLTVGASIGASFLEWVFAGATFWTISSHLLNGVNFVEIFSIYAIAAIAGALSMAPGGIGAFDLIALLGLTQLGHQSDQAMAVLVIFRLFYYIIPWLIGLVLAALEIGLQRGENRASLGVEPSFNLWQKIWGWPGQYTFLSDLGVWALGKLVMSGGLILLLSAATPELLYRLQFAEDLLSLPVMRISHHLSVLIGFMLILLSRGITLRVRSAYIWTSILLCGGAVFAFTKGFDYEEALFLLLVLLILWISRAQFYRISAPMSKKGTVWWFLMTLLIAFSYFLLGSYAHRGFLKHLPSGMQPEWMQQHHQVAFTAVAGLAFAWVLFALLVTLKTDPTPRRLFSTYDKGKLIHFLNRVEGNPLTHRLFLGDKGFFWAQEGQVLFAFAKVRDKLVVLGDPLGKKDLISEGIREFCLEADKYGLVVVFYQANPDFLSIYHEHGYRIFKLDEEALVPLDTFVLSKSNLSNVSSRFEREGYTFEVSEAPHSEALLRQLRFVSDEWLNGRSEKGYSVGWYKDCYLQLAPIALLRNRRGIVLAFSSITPGYDKGRTLSMDLMRNRNNTPYGTVDYLLIRILEWAKSKGYQQFNLGNAPLLSTGEKANTAASQEEKLAQLLFKRGGYKDDGFTDIRSNKEKFSPDWQSRYLAYPATVTLPILISDLVRLVSRHPEGKE